jgi:hypothetical protein
VYEVVAVLFTGSAGRHGIGRARALYVLDHHVWTFEAENDVTFYIGPDRNGLDLEVATSPARDGEPGDVYVIHAMTLRSEWREDYHRMARA